MKKHLHERTYHIVYRTERTDGSGRYYVGVHSTDDLADDYLGSGSTLKKSVKKYGKAAHSRKILHMCETRKEAVFLEKQIVNPQMLEDPLCMNIAPGGAYEKKRKEHPAASTNRSVAIQAFYDSEAGISARAKISATHLNKKETPEAIANMKVAAKARMARMKADGSWEAVKAKNSASASGKKQSEETKQKRNASLRLARQKAGGKFTFCEEARNNIGMSQRGNQKHAKTWELVDHDGHVTIITNLQRWLRETGMVTTRDRKGIKRQGTGEVLFALRKVQ